MLGKCFGIMSATAVITAVFTGRIREVGEAVLAGGRDSVTLCLTLIGTMAFWSGIMRLLEAGGAIALLGKLMSPILSKVFPNAYKSGVGYSEITSTVCANMLGIGNAATPFAVAAMNKLSEYNGRDGVASDDMVTFTVLACSSFNLLPATVLSLLEAAGCTNAARVIPPILICSFSSALLGILLSRGISVMKRCGGGG